jgi:betaine-aldehyde dehydrogenase
MIQRPTQTSFIHGQPHESGNSERLTIFYPATNEAVCQFEVALQAEVDAAVESAIRGQAAWNQMLGIERGRILNRAANLLRERNDELARLEVYDTGKPLSETSVVDVASAADALEYFAGLAPAIHGEHYQLGKNFAYTRREPLGVVAGIGAWNYPLQIACWKAAPALAAGNAMIYKPSELTPLTTVELAKTFIEAGLPPGVFNVVLGDARTGQLLVEHSAIKKISVTGSVSTGQKIAAAAGQRLKQVTLELGGKSPLIIFGDCDIDRAVRAAVLANFYTQGEVCSNGTRVFVERSIVKEFSEAFAAATRQLVIGDPLDLKTEVGSLISPSHCHKVMGYIDSGQRAGAKLICGGKRHGDSGNFVQPTIFADCHDDMQIVREEIFGPVASILTFESEAEVIHRANLTDYGLAAGVFTQDIDRAHRVVEKIEAGICWINNYNITPIEIPFGGYKHSGIGRENSPWALQHYTQLKTVYVDLGGNSTQ